WHCVSSPVVIFSFASYVYPDPLALHSFPTRRSSDLLRAGGHAPETTLHSPTAGLERAGIGLTDGAEHHPGAVGAAAPAAIYRERSEEHTSELQSRSDLVCRLLLEKKKQH